MAEQQEMLTEQLTKLKATMVKIARLGYRPAWQAQLFWRDGDQFYATRRGADLLRLQKEDVLELTFAGEVLPGVRTGVAMVQKLEEAAAARKAADREAAAAGNDEAAAAGADEAAGSDREPAADLPPVKKDTSRPAPHWTDNELWKRVLKRRRDMAALIVAKPKYALTCLEQGREIPAVLEDMAQIIGERVRVTDRYEEMIVSAFREDAGVLVRHKDPDDAVIAGFPGWAVTLGRDLYEAFVAMTILEKSAEVALKAERIGGGVAIPQLTVKAERLNYLYNYSQAERKIRKKLASPEAAAEPESGAPAADSKATTSGSPAAGESAAFAGGSDISAEPATADIPPVAIAGPAARERQARQLLVTYGRKLLELGLVQGTWGNLSVRLDDRFMLVTPSGRDYYGVHPEEMVKVRIENLSWEGDVKPSSEMGMHAGIYLTRPDVNAIIHTHAENGSVFAAAQMPLEVTDEGLAKYTGSLIPVTKFAPAGTPELVENAVVALQAHRACFLANHGMFSVGADLKGALLAAAAAEKAAALALKEREGEHV